MKVTVITPYDSANYGAYLQAYASKLFLEKQGFEVSFLTWRSEIERKQEFFNKPHGLKAKFRYFQKYPFLRQRYDVFSKSKAVFNEVESNRLKDGDTILIGSDEVWNIKVPKFQKDCFYGVNFPNGINKLAYAPSVANSSVADFYKFPKQSEGLKDITLIGARDEETKLVYDTMTGTNSELVCDPTLLLTNDEWKFPKVENKYGKYILVYSYDIPKSHRAILKEVARRRNCKLLAVGLFMSWCDYNICCSPLEFDGIIKNAEAVYTTTFHGSIFTLLNHKRCLIRANSKKLNDLLERFGVSSFKEPNQIDVDTVDKMLFMDRDYEAFDAFLNGFREKSRELYVKRLGEILE